MYLVTYEKTGGGLGCMTYGIAQVFNKPQAAHAYLKKLLKAQAALPFHERNKISYNLKTVELDNPFSTELFAYHY